MCQYSNINVFQRSNEFYLFQRRVSFSATVCLCARGQIRMCSWRGRRTGTDSSIREFSTRLLSRRCSTASLSSMRALPRDLFRFEKEILFSSSIDIYSVEGIDLPADHPGLCRSDLQPHSGFRLFPSRRRHSTSQTLRNQSKCTHQGYHLQTGCKFLVIFL